MMLVDQLLNLEQWHAHFDAQGFDFIAAGDNTAVVVTEYGNWLTDQVWPKYSFTTDVKIVAIDKHD